MKLVVKSYSKKFSPTGNLGLVHWDDPEGWYGEGGERGLQDGEHVYTRGVEKAYTQPHRPGAAINYLSNFF